MLKIGNYVINKTAKIEIVRIADTTTSGYIVEIYPKDTQYEVNKDYFEELLSVGDSITSLIKNYGGNIEITDNNTIISLNSQSSQLEFRLKSFLSEGWKII